MFNAERFQRRIASGELRAKLLEDGTPSPRAGEPPGTRSQIIAYLDPRGARVAIIHQYLRPDGSLGASGRQDPKAIRLGDIIYYVDLRQMF